MKPEELRFEEIREESIQILKENNIRNTATRVSVLMAMLEAEIPLEAKEIFNSVIEMVGEDSIWLSTVYRNLETFEEKGLIHGVTMPESDSIYYHLHEMEHEHYAICENCRKEIPLRFCYLEELSDTLVEKGFTAKYHRVEIFGLCEQCSHDQVATA